MKKLLILVVCLMLALTTASCGAKKNNSGTAPDTGSAQSSAADSDTAANDETDNGKNVQSNSDGKTEEAAEAPVIESTEQLEGMIDEFNSTDNPERKEELRKQLEAILKQAEEASSAAN